jgi:chromatin segregation and condensation protein Rec8/ScpA/Scc1 (kleisin family)
VGTNPAKARLIGIFLAILELLKSGEILAGQETLYGDIWLLPSITEQPPASDGDEAS